MACGASAPRQQRKTVCVCAIAHLPCPAQVIGSKGITWQTRLGVLLPEHLAFTRQLFGDSEKQRARGGADVLADQHISDRISVNDLRTVFEEQQDKRSTNGSQPSLSVNLGHLREQNRRIHSTLRLLKSCAPCTHHRVRALLLSGENRTLNREGTAAALQKLNMHTSDSDLDTLFDWLDADSSGEVDWEVSMN